MQSTIGFIVHDEPQACPIVHLILAGKLRSESFAHIVPAMDSLIGDYGRIRLLFDLSRFEGLAPGVSWQELLIRFKNYSDVERLAFVGDKKWCDIIAGFSNEFTNCDVRSSEDLTLKEALTWLAQSFDRKTKSFEPESFDALEGYPRDSMNPEAWV